MKPARHSWDHQKTSRATCVVCGIIRHTHLQRNEHGKMVPTVTYELPKGQTRGGYSGVLVKRPSCHRKDKNDKQAPLPFDDFEANAEWARVNKKNYEGKWIALLSGELLDCDDEKGFLEERIKDHPFRKRILLTFVQKTEKKRHEFHEYLKIDASEKKEKEKE